MELFERAHVRKKAACKMENKPSEAVKRQLKRMMSAYKQGNNEDIRKSSVIKPKYDMDETVSISDFSDFSVTKNADISVEAATSNSSDDLQTTGNSFSKSHNSDTDDGCSEDITECCEEFKSLSTSMDVSASTSFGNSAVLEADTDASEESIPSSLLTSTGSDTDISDDDEFDADGTLASKILENLVKNNNISKKRKIPKENVYEVSKHVNKTKEKSENIVKNKKKTKKLKQETYNNSTEYFVEEEFASDLERSKDTHKKIDESKKEIIFKDTNKKIKQKRSHQLIELSDESINNSIDSTSTSFSSPFISISAEDMSEQNFSELVGDYVHPTIRNLPTDKPHISIKSTFNMFPTDKMIVKDVIDDEISSLVPEVDEDLAIEDLNLDTDTQELIEESNAFNDIIPESVTDTGILEDKDMTTETIPLGESTIDDDTTEEVVPMTLYAGKEKYILVMKHPTELHIHGKVQIADINGMVEILGYKLNYDCVDVYAPYCNYAHCLKTLENPHQTNPDLYNELISVGLSDSDATEILSSIEDNTAVIILSKLNSTVMDFVDNNFSITDLFSKRGDYTPRFLKKAADNLGCSFYLKPPKKSFERKNIWDEIYEIGTKSRGIICGGKGVGKSTFLRHYVNTLLADGPVLVIDLDPGQAEFTMPGNISVTVVEKPLIGPNFTHLKTPERMLNIGIINTMDNAKRYLSAIEDLIAYCRGTEEFQELPWIVNTMGLCNHMGLKFMTAIILQLQPTFLFQIDSKVPKKRFEVQLDCSTVMHLSEQYSNDKSFSNIPPNFMEYTFITDRHKDAPPKGNVGLTLLPRDERYLSILAYFGKLLNDRSQGLLEIVPYEVSLRDLKIGLNVRIPRDMVAEVINGRIIALCQHNAHDKGQVFTLGVNALLCHGHGLIRGIDLKQGILYILTPTHLNKLHLVDTLVYSDWMPELRGIERDLPGGTVVPFRTSNTALHQRKLMFPPRRRFNPLQLLKMSRNT